MDEKHFELFCIKNDFAKYFAKQRNLFIEIFWDTSTLSQVSNCNGAVLEIYLDHKF